MSLSDKINLANAKIDTVKKTLLSSEGLHTQDIDKNTQDLLLKDTKDLQKNLGDKLESLKAKLKNKKLKKKNKRNIFEEILKTVNQFLATGRKANETDRFASIERLKYHAYGAAQDTMKSARKIIMEDAKKVLFGGEAICDGNSVFDALHDGCSLSPKEFDFLNMLKVPPDSDYGKIMYEKKEITTNKEKINRNLYSAFTSNNNTYQYDTPSNKTLFKAKWDKPTQKFIVSNLSQSGTTSQNPTIGQFFNDYYSNMEMPDFVNVMKNAMLLTTKCAKISVDKTGVSIGGNPTGMEDSLNFSPDLDKAINDLERFLNKILAFCNHSPNGLSHQSAFHTFNEDDEDDEYYFDFDDVEGIDLEDEDARRRKVLVFKDCNNFEIPMNANHMEDFIYLEGKKPINDWVNSTLDKVASDAYEQSFGGIQLPDFQVSIHLGFILNIPKAIIMSVLSAGILLPLSIIYKLFVGVALDVKDLMRKIKKWIMMVVTDLFWNFIRQFWKRIKADLKNFLKSIVVRILKEKLKRYYNVIGALVLLLKKVVEGGVTTCEDIFDLISVAIDLALSPPGNFDIPLSLLMIADRLPGFSVTKTTFEAQEKMNALGVPIGPVNGEPNYFMAAFEANNQAYTDNISKTPFISTNKPMKVITSLGPGLVLPQQVQNGALLKI